MDIEEANESETVTELRRELKVAQSQRTAALWFIAFLILTLLFTR